GLLDQYVLNASPSRPVDVAAISYDISDTTTHLVQLSLRHLSNRHLTFFLPKIAVHAVPLPPTLPFGRFPFSVQNKSRNLRSVTPDPCPIDLRRWTEFGISDRLVLFACEFPNFSSALDSIWWTWQTPGRDLLGYHEVRLVPPLRWYTPIYDAAYALIQGNRHLWPASEPRAQCNARPQSDRLTALPASEPSPDEQYFSLLQFADRSQLARHSHQAPTLHVTREIFTSSLHATLDRPCRHLRSSSPSCRPFGPRAWVFFTA
ncbi:hypothetical protein CMEL01_05265, partial [Colletotrichum melonis]